LTAKSLRIAFATTDLSCGWVGLPRMDGFETHSALLHDALL
jgi:hypothetical protein